jgi:Uma2 family endonuclease
MTTTTQETPFIEDGNIEELIDGKLILSPRPASKHMRVIFRLSGWLAPFDVGPIGGWWILPEVEILFIRDKLVPDLAGWRKEKHPTMPDGNPIEEIPDWVCGVVSPGSRKQDHKVKPPVYHRSKVGHHWLVEPEIRSLQAFRWTDAGWLLVADISEDDKAKVEPFEALELDLSLLWA